MSHCARHSPKYLIIRPLQGRCGGEQRILLAYDGSVAGCTALREGALLAKQCGAEVFLLSVLTDTGTLLLSEVTLADATVQVEGDFTEIADALSGYPIARRLPCEFELLCGG